MKKKLNNPNISNAILWAAAILTFEMLPHHLYQPLSQSQPGK